MIKEAANQTLVNQAWAGKRRWRHENTLAPRSFEPVRYFAAGGVWIGCAAHARGTFCTGHRHWHRGHDRGRRHFHLQPRATESLAECTGDKPAFCGAGDEPLWG